MRSMLGSFLLLAVAALPATLKAASLTELDSDAGVPQLIIGGTIDAFGANRMRLKTMVDANPGLRVLPGSLLGVPQAIILRSDQPRNLAAVNAFIEDVRKSGFLEESIRRANNGTEMEPAP